MTTKLNFVTIRAASDTLYDEGIDEIIVPIEWTIAQIFAYFLMNDSNVEALMLNGKILNPSLTLKDYQVRDPVILLRKIHFKHPFQTSVQPPSETLHDVLTDIFHKYN